MTTDRHFVFFDQGTGEYIRELKGPMESYQREWWSALAPKFAMNRWATRVSQPQRGEIGLDVTAIDWPVGDFCYCTLDLHQPEPLLCWGPMRFYVEYDVDTLQIVANVASHRPVRDAVPRQHVVDITGTWLESYHGSIFGQIVFKQGQWMIDPLRDSDLVPTRSQKALDAACIDSELFHITNREAVLVNG